jgi:hypothetical protein
MPTWLRVIFSHFPECVLTSKSAPLLALCPTRQISYDAANEVTTPIFDNQLGLWRRVSREDDLLKFQTTDVPTLRLSS